MKYKLVKLQELSGNKASIYAIYYYEDKKTSLDIFIEENKNVLLSELKEIYVRLQTIGHKTGAREQFFKLNEGNLGDGVCALYEKKGVGLRLYCIRYGALIIIIGGGGIKNVRKLQQNKKLKDENFFLRRLSALITKRIKDDDLNFTLDSMDFEGNFEFNDQEYE